MNDPHDPFNRPPEPERFEHPDVDPAEPFPTPAPPGSQAQPAQPEVSPFEPGSTHFSPLPPITSDDRLGVSPAAMPPLEPLPAMAGNFGPPPPDSPIDTQSLSSRLVDEFVAWLKTLASAAVYATLIVTFGFQVARVEGQSMSPTLEDQDRLIVNKFAYLSAIGEPEVGDIVMLYYPNKPEKSFVKRVIAKESDQLKIVNGKVYRNDVLLDDSFVPLEYRSHEDWGPHTIPEGYYFVMGDHRNNSSDSRHWGYVPKKYIIGRVQLRWWPVPQARTF